MYKIVFMRHGESTWNLENRFTGWTDVDLTEKGVNEAKLAGRLQLAHGFIGTRAALADDDQGTAFRLFQLADAIAQVCQRNVFSVAQVAGGKFVGAAHIQHQGLAAIDELGHLQRGSTAALGHQCREQQRTTGNGSNCNNEDIIEDEFHKASIG